MLDTLSMSINKNSCYFSPLLEDYCLVLVLEDKHGLSAGKFDKPQLVYILYGKFTFKVLLF